MIGSSFTAPTIDDGYGALLFRMTRCALGFALCLCLFPCAYAAPSKPAAKHAHAIVAQDAEEMQPRLITEEEELNMLREPMELMTLKIGSIICALLGVGYFHRASRIREQHSLVLEALTRESLAKISARDNELLRVNQTSGKLRENRDAWMLEAQKPKPVTNNNLYTPDQLREILGQ